MHFLDALIDKAASNVSRTVLSISVSFMLFLKGHLVYIGPFAVDLAL